MLNIYSIILKKLIKIHSWLYHRISKISTKLNMGIHPKHRIMKYHEFFVNNIENNSKILDIGCGSGYLTYDLAKKAREVIAMDKNRYMIEKAMSKFNLENIEYLVGDATKYEFQEHYDYIILSNVLEHIKKRKTFLNNLKKFTNYFLIRVPMLNRSWLSLYTKEIGLDYRLDPTHYVEYTLETFKNEIKAIDLTIETFSIQFGEIWARIKN